MKDQYEESFHRQKGCQVMEYTFGGYKPVQENREPIKPAPEEKKIKLDVPEIWDAEEPPEEEIGV